MGTIYRKGNRFWIGFKDSDGKWIYQTSGFAVGQMDRARKLLQKIEKKIEAGIDVESETGEAPHVIANYVKRWIARRGALGLSDWKNDEGRLRDHVLPAIGNRRFDEIRPRHLRDLFLKFRMSGALAPNAIRNVYSVTKALFRDATMK